MAIASIVLGVLSLLFAIGGFVVSFVPVIGAWLGVFFSFGAPVLALAGIVLGGVSLSRARSEGTETGAATAGVVVSIIAFFPAFLVAVSCGLCNSVCVAAQLDGRDRRGTPTPWYLRDAGGFAPAEPVEPVEPVDPIEPVEPPERGLPPPAFPPPPMPADEPAVPGDDPGAPAPI